MTRIWTCAATGTLCLATVVVTLTSCDTPKTTMMYDIVDTPTPIPAGLGPATVRSAIAPVEATPKAELVRKCGPGTGKNSEGVCEPLRTRDVGYVQRVQLPRGAFVMGDIPTYYDGRAARKTLTSQWSAQPPRRVEIGGYWIDLHEVTTAAYSACVDKGACTPSKCPEGEENPTTHFSEKVLPSIPQTCVTHEQAATFCRANGGSLPTEAQWEYAARGPDARIYPWGNDLRDEYRGGLQPLNGMVDVGYFGLRGMGSNATEWVADAFTLDAGLAAFISKPFRDPRGPASAAEAKLPPGWVLKGGKTGRRSRQVVADNMVGFRCAAELDNGQRALDLPADALPVPLVQAGEGVQFFAGVAELVNDDEAARFCGALNVAWQGEQLAGWRLPTKAEVRANAAIFRGPGPFWTNEGALVQPASGRPKQDDEWEDDAAKPEEALGARCVRGPA